MWQGSHKYIKAFILIIAVCLSLTACSNKPSNYPHGKFTSDENIFYSSFDEQPKTLDPARSYSEDSAVFLAQVIEPPLQYHYLKRPYQLIPLTVSRMPEITYLDANHQPLPTNTAPEKIAFTLYKISIQPGIYYQPHPALAKDAQGQLINLHLPPAQLSAIHSLSDFKTTGTRELTAADYVYEIKRLAAPNVNSPLAGLMAETIDGFAEYSQLLQTKMQAKQFLDLRQYPLAGVKQLDNYTYEITIKGFYRQFEYWLATNFFAPVPWEADQFYAQSDLSHKNISFDTYPVGTGPYYIEENNPNSRIILTRNPNFHHETYPTEGAAGDMAAGFLADAGKPLPFIDKYVFSLERESIPRWNKFLQGYYDSSGIASDNFDQAVRMDIHGQPVLSKELKQRGIRLITAVKPSVFFFGFNMLDPVVGGYDEQHRKLRQAIAIAVNMDEYISIFLNGRGMIAQQPIPPDIFGYISGKAGMNADVYDWVNGHPQRKPLTYAKQLLAEAGYPNGISRKTGKPLVLTYDAISSGGADERSQFDWLQKQFAKLNIQLIVNDTNYNRFQEKMRTGNAQLFMWGWGADYPDPENFLFILYGPNGKVKYGGENASNYNNATFNQLFEQMKNMPDTPARLAIILQMDKIFQQDLPWFGAFNVQTYQLVHSWVIPRKPNAMSYNTLKYSRIEPQQRDSLQQRWNQPHWLAIWVSLIVLLLLILPFAIKYWLMQRKPPKRMDI
jgi:ABC-type oligopeptide transport system substrate-binding subunit